MPSGGWGSAVGDGGVGDGGGDVLSPSPASPDHHTVSRNS